MIYTIKKASLISEQLRKFKDSNAWMVVGQFANLDFWIAEVKISLKAIDEHKTRFDKMYNAQKEFIEAHEIQIPDNCSICGGICELGTGIREPNLPKISSEVKSDKTEYKKELLDSTYYFLIRCYKLNLLNENRLRKICEEIGTSVDLDDLELKS